LIALSNYLYFDRLKDSDVTWLYGPLHTVVKQDDKYSKPKESSTQDKFGLIGTSSVTQASKPPPSTSLLKPALKKRSVSDILRGTQPKDTRVRLVDQPKRTSELSLTDQNNRVNAVSPQVLATHRQPKLRFNSYVEQCIALSDSDNEEEREEKDIINDTSHPSDSVHHHSDIYEDDDMMVLNVTKRSTSTPSIMKIEPTRLKRQAPGEHGAESDSSSVGSFDRHHRHQAIQWLGQGDSIDYDTTADDGRSRDMDNDLIQNYDWAAWDLGPVDSDDDDDQESDYPYQDVNYRQSHFDDEDDMEPPTLFFNEPQASLEDGEAVERLRSLANQISHQPQSHDGSTVVGNVVQWAKSYIFGTNNSS
jgi:transcriptional regulator of NAD metabolism